MDDVIALVLQNPSDGSLFQQRTSALVREQWRQPAKAAAQTKHSHVRMTGHFKPGLPAAQQVVGINAVNDIDQVSGLGEGVRQTIYVDPVSAKAIGGIEGRNVEEPEGAAHDRATAPMIASKLVCEASLYSSENLFASRFIILPAILALCRFLLYGRPLEETAKALVC
jgi:hypothetical protein